MTYKDSKTVIFKLWKNIFLSFISIALLVTSTLAYYVNTYTYEGGTLSTGEFDPDLIIEEETPEDNSPPLLMSPNPFDELPSNEDETNNNEETIIDKEEDEISEQSETDEDENNDEIVESLNEDDEVDKIDENEVINDSPDDI